MKKKEQIGIPVKVSFNGKEVKEGERLVLDGGSGSPTGLVYVSDMIARDREEQIKYFED